MSQEQTWFRTGTDGEEYAAKIKAQQEQERKERELNPKIFRFRLTPGNSAHLVFLDTAGFFFYEHNIPTSQSYYNYVTCLKDFGDCPVCKHDQASKRYHVAAYTVINLDGYTKRDGTQVHGVKQLLMVKSQMFDKIADKRSLVGGDLTMNCFRFKRYADKEAAIGSDIDFIKKVDPSQLEKFKPAEMSMEDFLKPVDYLKEFKPLNSSVICDKFGYPMGAGASQTAYNTSPQPSAIEKMDPLPGEAARIQEQAIDELL